LIALLINLTGCSPKTEISEEIITKTFNYPVLKGKKNNPVLRIQINNAIADKLVNTIQLTTGDKLNENIKKIRIFYTGLDSVFNDKKQFGASETVSQKLNFDGSQKLDNGTNYFWVSYELNENCDLTSKVSVPAAMIGIESKTYSPFRHNGQTSLRLGVAVRDHGDDNVHTYRIPGLTTANQGTLLAIYDVRRESGRDLQGNIDIGVSRSTDG